MYKQISNFSPDGKYSGSKVPYEITGYIKKGKKMTNP